MTKKEGRRLLKIFVVLLTMILVSIRHRKKVKVVELRWRQFGWLFLYSLIPLMVYYLFELIPSKGTAITIQQDMGKVVIKTPFLYFFFFSVIWFVSSLRKREKPNEQYLFIIPLILIPFSFQGLVGSVIVTDTVSKTTEIKSLTKEVQETIKGQFMVTIPENTQNIWLYDRGWRDAEYMLEFQLSKSEFDLFENELLNHYQRVKNEFGTEMKYASIDDQSISVETKEVGHKKVLVVFTINWDAHPNDNYRKLFYKNASVWNTIKREGFFPVLFG